MIPSAAHTYKLVIAYNGARFKGWQRGNGRTIQATLEEALRTVIEHAPAVPDPSAYEVRADGAGRTDAGVHAEGQVASVVLPFEIDEERVLRDVNRELPWDLSVLSVESAPPRFHARYLATAKTYRYRILDGPVGSPFLHRLAWRVQQPLDPSRMQDAAASFVGTHDFAAFTIDRGKPNTTRTVRTVHVDRSTVAGARPIEITVAGEGFMWKQVRIMAAALAACGSGEADAETIATLLASRDRSRAPAPAPPWGLTLVSVTHRNPPAHEST